MARIVVLGAGLGGVIAAYEIKKAARRQDEVIVINETSFYQFVPSNPWILVGWRERKDILVDLEKPMKRRGIQLIVGRAARVEAAGKCVRMEDGSTIEYDYLVIATGPELAFDDIEGLGPEGHTQSVCHIDHATAAYDAFQKFCEDPGPVIVGAVQGASCFGPAYETAMIIETELRNRKIRDKVPMTFVTSEPYIGHLGLDGVGDTKGLLESEMRERHIKWITNAKVDAVEADHVKVTEHDERGEPIRAHELPSVYTMFIPAFKGVDAVATVPGLCNPRGFVLIDAYQRNPTYPNIYSAGVCVAIPPVEATPVPTGAPKTGYMIESMVTAIVHNIKDTIEGREPGHKATWNAICLADLGDDGVAFVALPQIPPRNVTWAKQGKWVHWAKVAFEKYFLRKMKTGNSEPIFEKYVLKVLGIVRLKG